MKIAQRCFELFIMRHVRRRKVQLKAIGYYKNRQKFALFCSDTGQDNVQVLDEQSISMHSSGRCCRNYDEIIAVLLDTPKPCIPDVKLEMC